MAYEIVKRLRQKDQQQILNLLSEDVSASDRRAGKLHQVFRDSFDAKEIMSDRMMLQKLDYMHSNPVSKKWRLAVDDISYLHSSARYYATEVQGIFKLTHYRDV